MDETTAGRSLLLRIYAAALRAVEGRKAVRGALTARPALGPCWLVAVGKAAESMTLGALDCLGAKCRGGLLIGREPPSRPRLLEDHGVAWMVGGHPVPDEGSLAAGSRLLEHLGDVPVDWDLLFLLSGGASSLVEVPADGIGLDTLRRVNRWLLGSGLPIADMNRVRTALSRIKGGGLLSFLPKRHLRALAISDVPGDDPGVIGSGLLVPRPELAGSLAGLEFPDWLRGLTALGLAARPDPVPPGPPVELVAGLGEAKRAAVEEGWTSGLPVEVAEPFLDGEASERGAELARAIAEGPTGLRVWGGETTVRLPPSPGRGGRCQHLALAAALELAGREDCLLLAAGTDGSDGNSEDAGALVDGGTLERGGLDGLNPRDCLLRADAGRFLAASGDLIHTGPTGTNVMDLVLGLKLPLPVAGRDGGP
jgi:glycerate 2-kinase